MQQIYPIEELIPHRATMRLIDTILSIDPDHAVVQATVKDNWPMITADGVNPLVLIELAAQTAGVCFGWNEQCKPVESRGEAKGWIVGVRGARFDTGPIAIATCITIRSETSLVVESYKEITAHLSIGAAPIAQIHLQVLQAEKSAFDAISGPI